MAQGSYKQFCPVAMAAERCASSRAEGDGSGNGPPLPVPRGSGSFSIVLLSRKLPRRYGSFRLGGAVAVW
jgi:hypothetical protein